jgi:hypothetical protein
VVPRQDAATSPTRGGVCVPSGASTVTTTLMRLSVELKWCLARMVSAVRSGASTRSGPPYVHPTPSRLARSTGSPTCHDPTKRRQAEGGQHLGQAPQRSATSNTRLYSDEKVANRDTKVWHLVIENGY